MNFFKLTRKSKKSQARIGVLTTAYGQILTPFFMPIATQGTVKTLSMMEMKKLGASIILGNSYHLYLKPGLSVIRKAGGLHQFMDWSGPILTDSGGFQVFSLGSKEQRARNKEQGGLVKVTNKGVEFRSVYNGSKHLFTPRSVIKMQETFGSDIMMVLDECVKNPCSYEKAEVAVNRTLRWAEKSRNQKIKPSTLLRPGKSRNQLFGIIQGSLYKDLRTKCAQELVKMDFDGYAIGGLAVGENLSEMYKVLDYTVPELPENKPRYLMGVGYPEQIIESVKRGVDMFDCVIPTREARHGRLYNFIAPRQPRARLSITRLWSKRSYQTINIKAKKFAKDTSSINPNSKFPELQEYSKAYLRHLFSVNEPLALRLATLNNLEFYLDLMKKIRLTIITNDL